MPRHVGPAHQVMVDGVWVCFPITNDPTPIASGSCVKCIAAFDGQLAEAVALESMDLMMAVEGGDLDEALDANARVLFILESRRDLEIPTTRIRDLLERLGAEGDGFCVIESVRGSSRHPSRCLNEAPHFGLICSYHHRLAERPRSRAEAIEWLLERGDPC